MTEALKTHSPTPEDASSFGPGFSDTTNAPYPGGPMPEGMPQDPFVNPDSISSGVLFQQPGEAVFKRPETDAEGGIETSEEQVATDGLEGVVSFTEKVYANGTKHVYGETAEGKKVHVSYDAILAAYDHAGDMQGKKPAESDPAAQPTTSTETAATGTTSTETQPAAPTSTEAPVDPKTPEATEDDAVAKELALLRKAKAEWVETFGEDGYAARFGGNPDVDPDAYMKKVEAQRNGTADSGEDSDPADPDQSATPAPDSRPSWNPNSMIADGLRPKGPSMKERFVASRQRRADKRATNAAASSRASVATTGDGQAWSASNLVAAGIRPKGSSMKERFVAARQRRADKRAAQPPSQANTATTGTGQAWSPDSLVAAGVKERTPKDPDAPVLKTPKIDTLDLTRDPDAPRPTAAEAAQAMADANRSNIDKLDITTGRDFSAVPPKPSRWAPPAGGGTPPPAAPSV